MFRIDYSNEIFCEVRDAVFSPILIPWEEVPELSKKLLEAIERHNKLMIKKAEKLRRKNAVKSPDS